MKKNSLSIHGCIVLLLLTLFCQFAVAQNANTGEIKGTVTDASGAVLPGAKVTITNVQNGVSTAAITNSAGIYDAPSVPVGEYKITFSKEGFRDFVRQGISLQLQTVAIDATLQVGTATEQVVVTEAVPLLQTETSDQQVSFDTKQVLDAPTVGGIWFTELTKVLPGISGGGPGLGNNGNKAGSNGDGVAVNGTQAFSANFQIEGTGVTDLRDGNVSNNYPPIDAIGEVTVQTANAGPQSGNGLLFLNVNLKSGTNRWHGSLFEFNQNDFFESRNYFNSPFVDPGCTRDKNDSSKCKKGVVRWNEYGGSVGGPILKDKLFFHFTYQRNPQQSGGFFTTTVPTDAMRSGDFSNPAFPTIYDSSSCSPAPCARAPLNGGTNQIASGQIDPVAAAILSYIPHPTNPNALTDNFSAIVATPSKGEWYVAKLDYQISQKHRLSGAILEYPTVLTFNPDALCGLGFDCTTSTPNNRNQSARITETWMVGPTMVNEFRVGAMREHDQYAPKTWQKGFLTKLGIEPQYGANAPVDVFPNIAIDGTSVGVANRTFIGGGVHANLVEDMYSASDVLTLIRGKHTVKLGGELDRQFQHDTTWGDSSSGDFTFTGVGTNSGTSSDPRNGGSTSPGVPFADFLLGDVGTWNIFNGEPTNIASWITSAFVNDDFKVTPRLTLNVGLRFQHQTGWAVADDRFGNFDPSLPNPGVQPSSYPGKCTATECLGAVHYGGVNGHNTIEPSVNAWSPRIGFAWSPMNRWSFRGSYGVFQNFRGTELYAHDNFPATLGLGFTPHGFIGDGTNVAFPLQTGPPPGSLIVPTVATLTPDQFNFDRVGYYAPKLPLTYFQEFLLSVQRELPAGHVLDVSYVHTKGTHLNFATDMNQVPANLLADPANTGDFSPLRPIPWFRSILAHDFTGWSNYDALQLRIAKRLTRGLYYQFNYSWSKLLDTGTGDGHDQNLDVWQIARDPRANYGISLIDAPHNFNGSISYEIPFGEGRAYPLHGVLNQVAGGWRITSVIQAHSGVPFTPTVPGNDPAGSGSPNCFCGYSLLPNRIGSGELSNPSIAHWWDTSAFVDPTLNGRAFGDSGRNILRGPRFVEVDLGLGKAFRIRESMSLEIRADSYNAFNHPQFGQPNTSISSVGEITSANNGGPGRIIQMGGRFSF
jgi:Carboxypeptidase regulatory-like domain/TonB dependent receptor